MKDLRAEKEQLTIQKDAQYDTYHYFKDYHKELQTVCANVDSILGTEQEVQQHEQVLSRVMRKFVCRLWLRMKSAGNRDVFQSRL